MIAMADGDYAAAIANLRRVLVTLEGDKSYGSHLWTAAQNELARAQYMAGDFRGALQTDSANLKLVKQQGLTNAGRYFALASLNCNAQRSGGQPLQSRAFADQILRHQPTGADARDVEMLRAQLALESRQFAQASSHAQAALDIARESAIDPKSSAWIGEALLLRARAEAAVGDLAKSRSSAQEALPHLQQNLDPSNGLIAGARAVIAG